MRVFVTGSTGWVGSVVVRELVEAGHEVIGLVRSEQNARALGSAGAEPLLGSLGDLEILKGGASRADGVIHLAFGTDFWKIAELAREDAQAIEAFGEVFEGSERPIVVTSGFGLLPAGSKYDEDTPLAFNPAFPRASEQTTLALAARGLHATVVRLPRVVHGIGERHGFVPMLANLARDKGVSAYVGDGQNLWPSVHRLDAGRVFRLAVEHGAQGGPFHAVADEGVPFRRIAEAIGQHLGLPVQSLSPDEAMAHFGPMAMFIAGNGPASSDRTRATLGWTPQEPDLISDLGQPAYYG